MKLHWSPRSPFVRKVMICAHETGLAGRLQLVRTTVAMTEPNPELMRDNPLSKIPTLITDAGDTLYDSHVICEYLDSLHSGEKLFPAAGEQRWQVLRRHALGDNLLDALVLWRNERIRPDAQRSSDLIAAFDSKLQATLDTYEREGAAPATGWLEIDDITLGCVLGYLDFRFSDIPWRPGRAGLAHWYQGFAERTSAKMTWPGDG